MFFGKVFSAENGEEAYAIYEDEAPDIIITDIRMPKKDGLKLIKHIRKTDYEIPIILLTSFAEQEMLMNAANLSIDGYLIKPLTLEVLIDTISKAIKRTHVDMGLVILGEHLFFNSATKEMYQNNSVVSLGSKEQALLILLLKNHPKTTTKDEITNKLWPLDPICDSAVKNLVLRMRKKLNADIIVSVKGIGYRLHVRKLPSMT